MVSIEHTANWFKGEAFVGGMIILWGLALIIPAAYFWKFGHYATSRALIVPFLVVGLFSGIAGGVGLYRNTHRIEHKKEAVAFIESEKKRVASFFDCYRYLFIGWVLLNLAGLAIFVL